MTILLFVCREGVSCSLHLDGFHAVPNNRSLPLKQLKSPTKSKKSTQEDPFWLCGSGFERIGMGVLSLFLVGMGVFVASSTGEADEKGVVIFMYIYLAVMQLIPLAAIYKSLTWLYIYQEGILIHVPFRRNQFLGWRQITRVRTSLWGKTLVLSNDTGRIKARVYPNLRNSNYFIGWFLQQRPDLWKPEEGLSFSKSSIFSIYFLIGALIEFGLALFLRPFFAWGFWGLLVLACMSVVTVFGMPLTLVLQGDNLVLRYPFRERKVSAKDIVKIEAVYSPLGYIVVRLKDGEKIVLRFFSLGINLLFAFLWSWHDSWMRPNLVHGAWDPRGVRIPHQLTTLPALPPPGSQQE
jgi:hypothetical protein